MLASLHIENIAVIRNIDIDFEKGFTVFTGETGAGKSIIIDSINFLLGSKSGRELIRSGEKSALVSALFRDMGDETAEKLKGIGVEPDENGELLIQRTLNDEGRSSARLNGRSVSVSVLKEVSAYLINIHGQHDTRSLLDPETHISLLDAFSENEALLGEYKGFYTEMNSYKAQINALEKSLGEKERMLEILSYQLEDIDNAKLKPGEEDELLSRRTKLQNMERISKQIRFVYKALYTNEKGVTAASLARRSAEALSSLSDVLPEVGGYAEKLENFAYEMEDIAESARDLIGYGGMDPQTELNDLEDRLGVIRKLKRKYGSDENEVLAYRDKIKKQLDDLETGDDRIEELKREYNIQKGKAEEKGLALREKRKRYGDILEKEVCKVLEFLEMPKVRFKVRLDGCAERFAPNGMDSVEFLLSANPGEPLKPLSKIASGGELSRIMLALKSVLREKESTGTIIFDEVDAGISGKTSQKLGIKLKQTSENCQVICVTHSAQIAALSDSHLFISKKESGGRIETQLRLLDRQERIGELARIMGGRNISSVLLRSAEELLDDSLKD